MDATVRDRFRGCLLGLAVGDALGTAVEFQPRGSFTPVTDMAGGGPFRLKPGQWTDDTSMALCLADDADTTAAVCGQIAGAFYNESGIPADWLEKLCMREEIAEFADRLREGGS